MCEWKRDFSHRWRIQKTFIFYFSIRKLPTICWLHFAWIKVSDCIVRWKTKSNEWQLRNGATFSYHARHEQSNDVQFTYISMRFQSQHKNSAPKLVSDGLPVCSVNLLLMMRGVHSLISPFLRRAKNTSDTNIIMCSTYVRIIHLIYSLTVRIILNYFWSEEKEGQERKKREKKNTRYGFAIGTVTVVAAAARALSKT